MTARSRPSRGEASSPPALTFALPRRTTHSPNRAPSARKTSSGYRANSYDAFGYDDDYEDDYIAPEFKAANYYGYNYDSDYRDWVPGEPAPWDPCDADPDICCGYDH